MLTLTAAMGSAPVRAPPPRSVKTELRPDGLDAARGVLLAALIGLAGWIAIGVVIAACTSR